MAFLIQPTKEVVEAEAQKLGIEALWVPGECDWIVRIPNAPVREWYRTYSSMDAINTAKVMARLMARGESATPKRLAQAKAAAGLAPRLTKERLVQLINSLDKGKKIYLCAGGLYILVHKSNILDAVLLSIPDGHIAPLWLDTFHDEYHYVLRVHPEDKDPSYV